MSSSKPTRVQDLTKCTNSGHSDETRFMSSSQPSGVRTPFQDLTNNTTSGQRPDPKELKRQRERERYARNRDDINRRKKVEYKLKKDAAANMKGKHTTSITTKAISPGFHTTENATGQSTVTQQQSLLGKTTEGIPIVVMSSGATPFHRSNSFRSNGSAYSNKENLLNGEANSTGSKPECGIQTNATPINSLDIAKTDLQSCASPLRTPYEATNVLQTPSNQKSNRWISDYTHEADKGKEVIVQRDKSPLRSGPERQSNLCINETINPPSWNDTSSCDDDLSAQMASSMALGGTPTSSYATDRAENSIARRHSDFEDVCYNVNLSATENDCSHATSVTKQSTKHVPTRAIVNVDKNQIRRLRDRERRNKLTSEQREAINARRRERDRKKRDLATQEQKEKRSAERRSLHNSLTPDEKQKFLARQRASYETRRKTPCAASIAMPCPTVSAHTSPDASPQGSPLARRGNYSSESDGDYLSRTFNDNLTPDDQVTEQRPETRSQRRTRERAHKEILAAEQRRDKCASRRANRQNIPHGERHAQQQCSNARFAENATTSSHTVPASGNTQDYTIGTDGNNQGPAGWQSSWKNS